MPAVGDRAAHRRWLRRSLIGTALGIVAIVAAACATADEPAGGIPGFFPPPASSEGGASVDRLYPLVFYIAVGVFLLVEGLLIWIVLRYRRRPADGSLPTQTHGHNLLEIIWTAIPALIVTGLFVLTLDTLAEIERVDAQPGSVVVDVTGFQWQWTFDYPNEGLSFTGAGAQGPTMAVPVGERVRVRLHADDVIHSFYVPQFRYKKDVLPGRVNEFDMLVTEPGSYTGQCAEFCGLSHYEMFFTVEAMSRADYDAWVVEQQQAPEPTASPPPDAAVVEVTSISITEGFEPTTLTAPADSAWVVQLTNADPNVPHDFAVRGANADGSDWQGDPDAPGGGSATYQPPQLGAGTYEFYCSLHPATMVGTLNVGE